MHSILTINGHRDTLLPIKPERPSAAADSISPSRAGLARHGVVVSQKLKSRKE
jgi:hypothetical protein